MNSKRFVHDLLVEVPELNPLYKEHIKDYEELLPHVFMGDVTRFVTSLNADNSRNDFNSATSRQTLLKILDFLEDGMNSVDEVQELIAVSFLENLDQTDENYTSLKSHFGKSLLKQLAKYEDQIT